MEEYILPELPIDGETRAFNNFIENIRTKLRQDECHDVCDILYENLRSNSARQNDIVYIQGQIKRHQNYFNLKNINYLDYSFQMANLSQKLINLVSALSTNHFKPEFLESLNRPETPIEQFDKLLGHQETESSN